MGEIHILTGPERRRRWSDTEKRAIVAPAFAPGAVVSAVARRADVCSSLIYRWRQQLPSASCGFAEVIVGSTVPGFEAPPLPPGTGTADAAALEVAFGDQVRLRLPPSTPPALAAAVVSALAAQR
jgi:transposase